MDSTKLEKYQAMKRYKYNSSNNSLSSLVQHSLLVATLGLFLSSPLWLPTLCSSIKLFFIESLPRVVDAVLGPKCLFLVFNLIIIFLVGESRLSSSSTEPDIYEEYAVRAQRLKGVSSGEDKENGGALASPLVGDKEIEKEEELIKEELEEEELIKEELEEEELKQEELVEEELEEEELKQEELVEEELEEEELQEEGEREERGLPAEELNKRVEDFIARVNMQRRLEARMLVCCCG